MLITPVYTWVNRELCLVLVLQQARKGRDSMSHVSALKLEASRDRDTSFTRYQYRKWKISLVAVVSCVFCVCTDIMYQFRKKVCMPAIIIYINSDVLDEV